MSKYITDFKVSQNDTDESQLRAQGFSKTDVDLNKGAGGQKIHLWYKKGNSGALTRIQFSFMDDMAEGLSKAGYLGIPLWGQNSLWFFCGSTEYDVPIVDLDLTFEDDAQKFKDGWERLACDLNREARGWWIYLWVKREKPTYICDITANANFLGDEDYFKKGYIRVDEDTNRGAGGAYVFIFYRQTTKKEGAIKQLKLSTSGDEDVEFKNHGYKQAIVSLNKENRGKLLFLWYKKDDCSSGSIKAITQVVTRDAVDPFEAVGVEVIEKNLNTEVKTAPQLFLCYYR